MGEVNILLSDNVVKCNRNEDIIKNSELISTIILNDKVILINITYQTFKEFQNIFKQHNIKDYIQKMTRKQLFMIFCDSHYMLYQNIMDLTYKEILIRITRCVNIIEIQDMLDMNNEQMAQIQFMIQTMSLDNKLLEYLHSEKKVYETYLDTTKKLIGRSVIYLRTLYNCIQKCFPRMPSCSIKALLTTCCISIPNDIVYSEIYGIVNPILHLECVRQLAWRCDIISAILNFLKEESETFYTLAGGMCRVLTLLYKADTSEKALHAAKEFIKTKDADIYIGEYRGKYAKYNMQEIKILKKYLNLIFPSEIIPPIDNFVISNMFGGSGTPNSKYLTWKINNNADNRMEYSPQGYEIQITQDEFRKILRKETDLDHEQINYLIRHLGYSWWKKYSRRYVYSLPRPQNPSAIMCGCYIDCEASGQPCDLKINMIYIHPDGHPEDHISAISFAWNVVMRFDFWLCMAFTDGNKLYAPNIYRIYRKDGVEERIGVEEDIIANVLVPWDWIRFHPLEDAMYISCKRIITYINDKKCIVKPEKIAFHYPRQRSQGDVVVIAEL